MTDLTLRDKLTDLFKQAATAHHEAYASTDGADPDWPIWYAEYLHEPLGVLLNARFTRSELVYVIVGLDKELQQTAPGADWATFWARSLLDRYS
jgi:NAD(P)H-hydrate epimerase